MGDLTDRLHLLRSESTRYGGGFDLPDKVAQAASTGRGVDSARLLGQPEGRTAKMQKLNALLEQIRVWDGLKQRTQDGLDLSEMAEDDAGMLAELEVEANALDEELEKREFTLALNGKYDPGGAIFSIPRRGSGTEAQDWAAMLQRMYCAGRKRRATRPRSPT